MTALPALPAPKAGEISEGQPHIETSEFHLQRALRCQAALRIAIVVALAIDLTVFPPRENQAVSALLAVGYGLWTIVMLWAAWKAYRPYRSWVYPLTDLIALTVLMAVSGGFSDPAWNSPVANDVFLFIPVLASFLMRPYLTAVSGVLAAACYALGTGIGHRDQPYWSFTLMHSLFILVVCAGCVLLSAVQQGRMRVIRELAEHRLWLLERIMAAEESEQRKIAEVLHDGALQNVLAARHFIDEARGLHAPADNSLERADEALTSASRQLRSSVRTLHPEVLVSGGLVPALEHLVALASERGRFEARVRSDMASAGSADRALYWLARELIENVVKHAHARNVEVRLQRYGGTSVKMTISDDGVGISQEALQQSLSSGHIGIASHRARIESLGGVFTLKSNQGKGHPVVHPLSGTAVTDPAALSAVGSHTVSRTACSRRLKQGPAARAGPGPLQQSPGRPAFQQASAPVQGARHTSPAASGGAAPATVLPRHVALPVSSCGTRWPRPLVPASKARAGRGEPGPRRSVLQESQAAHACCGAP
jgi:two-component system NarL family sensor kinase